MIAVLFAAAALLADTTPAAAQAATPAAPAAAAAPAKTAAKDDRSKLICHSEVVTGSMFPTKVCVRKDEAAEQRREQQMDLYKAQSFGAQHQ